MNLKPKYKLHQKIKSSERLYEVIGYEYVSERGLRYILLHIENGTAKWEYLYYFEIKAMI